MGIADAIPGDAPWHIGCGETFTKGQIDSKDGTEHSLELREIKDAKKMYRATSVIAAVEFTLKISYKRYLIIL